MTFIKVVSPRPQGSHGATNSVKEDKGSDNTEYKFKNVLKWFVQFTSIGGFTQSRDSDNKISRAVWGVLFMVGLVLTIAGIVSLIIDFCQFGSLTNVQLAHSSSGMLFPSVSVCNTNRIHCGHLYNKIILCKQVSLIQIYGKHRNNDSRLNLHRSGNLFFIFRTQNVQERRYIVNFLFCHNVQCL